MNQMFPIFLSLFFLFSSCEKKEETAHAYNPEIRFRGVNTTMEKNTILTEADVARWKSWGINLVRVNFNKDDIVNAYTDAPEIGNLWKPYAEHRQRLKEWLLWLDKYEIAAMVSLDILYGDNHDNSKIWSNNGNNDYLQHRIDFAAEMAEWLKQFPNALFLEVWNEPYPYDALYESKFLPKVIEKIEGVDPNIKIVCMPPIAWGSIHGFANWDGLRNENVIYSTHIYEPWMYTHQGAVDDAPLTAEGWPGCHKNFPTDATATCLGLADVHEFLKTATDFEQRTGKRIMITEFGVVRWAKNSDRYLDHLTQGFEQAQLDWVLHSLADWNGWNPTFLPDAPQNNAPYGGEETPAFLVMKAAWQKNQ